MKTNTHTVYDILTPLRIYFQGENTLKRSKNEEPFRSELYNSGQLDIHAGAVARSHRIQQRRSPDQLLKRLDQNERALLEVRNLLVEAIRSNKPITPGAEWLLDNFYLIEEQVVIARKHLPKGYSEGLPALGNGISSGMPRVYDIVLEIISHSDGRVDLKSLGSFIASYQENAVLSLGELWAIPIMLRLAVLENLRRVSGKIALDLIDHNLADFWADRMTETVRVEPGNLVQTIADMARSGISLDSAFVAGFSRMLQGKGPALALPLSWMEQQLSALGTSSDELVRQENQKQAADQVSVRNSIGTLRFLGATDWRKFVEALSSVEKVLRKDLTGTYSRMDFATRDRYRHAVEAISKRSILTETEVAGVALGLSAGVEESAPNSPRLRHIGYYLIGPGLEQTEKAAGMHFSLMQRLRKKARHFPLFIYLGSIFLISLTLGAAMWWLAYKHGVRGQLLLSILGILCLSCTTQLAVSLVNWMVAISVRPKLLPRMDFSAGIPDAFRTLVVVPSMLASKAQIEALTESLEIRFLANREDHLHFGLLTDFGDAPAAVLPQDHVLLEQVKKGIQSLNQHYERAGEDIFFLFHRPRSWNEREKIWMGYERKRGKLSALNAFIRGRGKEFFSLVVGDPGILNQVKYVITLDADTQLPRESAWKFIATMAHPLNRAVYDPVKRRVTEGYGILQPRVATAIPRTAVTPFLRMQGNASGIDPYTRVSSEVYQDLFAEGSFIGKGIYDVDLFDQAVNGVFQENRILSHDLVEGCYARSGLISDVNLYEETPSNYQTDIRRHHRWIRGDWQIGAWMLPFVTGANGRLVRNRLSWLSRWKIFDNLRRSLVPLSMVALLGLGWFRLPFPWFWTLSVLLVVLVPVSAEAFWRLLHKPADLLLLAHLKDVGVSFGDILTRFIFSLAVLPYEAVKYTDALLRTNWRLLVSGRKLLEWTPSAQSSLNPGTTIRSAYLEMAISPILALVCAVSIAFRPAGSAEAAVPFLVLWALAPLGSWWLGRPDRDETMNLSWDQKNFLRESARRTWSYFEQFVTAEEAWLPPDNYQVQPAGVIAHRTSPTNMGLSLLANLAAYDFGFIPSGVLALRCRDALESMGKLERYHGHFFNWYSTLTLQPLPPRYVSTVDTGNLTGHLITLRQGLLSLPSLPVVQGQLFEGLRTTARLIQGKSGRGSAATEGILDILADLGPEQSGSLRAIKTHLDRVEEIARGFPASEADLEHPSLKWMGLFQGQIREIREDLLQLSPWLNLAPVPAEFPALSVTDQPQSLKFVQGMGELLNPLLDQYEQTTLSPENRLWLKEMRGCIARGGDCAGERIELLGQLASWCEDLSTVEYDFLFDPSTSLLRIGYNVDEQRRDGSSYDLLASEARLGVFVAIAQGQLPQESWFDLGRLLTNSGRDPVLLSWSGSMFEYLMPQIVMPSYENTLLYQTGKSTVRRQIEYGGQRGVPWGISESAYNLVDANLNYQYKAFGVPGLGLKRGLEEDLVIAPYASMLALMVHPRKACSNLRVMDAMGFQGEFGFYEAIDYTASRLARGQTHAIVNSLMAHHQGMSLLSMAYVLLDKPMQKRFIADLRMQATLLLLQECIPRATLFYAHTADLIKIPSSGSDTPARAVATPHTRIPEVQLLGNGRYQVMVTNSGGGYSRWKDIAITRWREDTTQDDRGIFCYIKDIGTGKFWSNTYQPTLHPVKLYEAIFSQGHMEFRRQDYGIWTRTEIIISPEDDAEMRRVTLTNRGSAVKTLEITSYAEIVLAPQDADESHPAFSNLFVDTEIRTEDQAVFCTRRPRSREELPPWMFHLMEVQGAAVEGTSYETDRMRFIGRGRTLSQPLAMEEDRLSGSQGPVLDPVASIRYRISLKPNQTATVHLIYGIAENRVACEALMLKYRDHHLKRRAFELSWTHSQVLLRQINATEGDAQLYDQLAGYVIYANPCFRAESPVIQSNFRGPSALWSYSVSGDLPIVLLHVYDPENMDLVRQMVQAHAYWRLKGLEVDLVIWNEDHGSYRQTMLEKIMSLITSETGSQPGTGKPGNIFVKSGDQVSTEDRVLFESVARVVLHDNRGSLSEQLGRVRTETVLPPLLERKLIPTEQAGEQPVLPGDLQFFNGIGGFTPGGKEYQLVTDRDRTTPAPWVNVIANPEFGTVLSESGSSYTWALNSHEYRITPWNGDPVSDRGGEAFYLRDEETGRFWSPSQFPCKSATPYRVTHGFGYTCFDHEEEGIFSNLCVYVDPDAPIKFMVIKIRNGSGRERKCSVTGFLETVLGELRSRTGMHILSEQDPETGALLIRNRYNLTFSERVTFFMAWGANQTCTGDRAEFIGRNRNLADPQAMYRKKLSGKTGAGLDPCAAIQVKFELLDGMEREIIFQLGNEENLAAARELIQRFSNREAVTGSLEAVRKFWERELGVVTVTTPDPSLNILSNGWLLYQTLSCRLFARTGFYQSGGAYGFRDQLQDVVALLLSRPAQAREQILLCASRQFAEGDVQHWWHPPEGRGVRTHCSDDLLWLPFTVCKYIGATGDMEILQVQAGYLESRPLHPDEDSLYDMPVTGTRKGSLYEHCVLAIKHSLKFGKHGLPLMGSGDWNDGMDRVGSQGRGESVWLGFFQYGILNCFGVLAANHGDPGFSGTCIRQAQTLRTSLETHGWDGSWYRRAFFDDGTPLGSREDRECRIDSIAQSWSVLSGAARDERKVRAMASVDELLVNRNLMLIALLDPAFAGDGPNPGYIKGYPPGIRENGGQYTHAAVWTLMAFAELGDRDKVWELFRMIDPVRHSLDFASMQTYKVEPYVMAADVYSCPSHLGRGGWTWYTGSAGWMYQFLISLMIGMELKKDRLIFKPCFPKEWPSVSIGYCHGVARYQIRLFQIENPSEAHWSMDGVEGQGNSVPLVTDEGLHEVDIYA